MKYAVTLTNAELQTVREALAIADDAIESVGEDAQEAWSRDPRSTQEAMRHIATGLRADKHHQDRHHSAHAERVVAALRPDNIDGPEARLWSSLETLAASALQWHNHAAITDTEAAHSTQHGMIEDTAMLLSRINRLGR